MEIVTKSQFADYLRVSRARVSQLVAAGLPVRADGKIDMDKGLEWVRMTIAPDANGGGASAVASRAAAERNGESDNPATAAARLALGVAFAQIPSIAREAAREAGATPEVVDAIAVIAHRRAAEACDRAGIYYLGLPPRDEWPKLETCLKLAGVVQ